MSLKNYSTTAASNNSASPNGAPEGMAMAGVNDTIRQVMADIRTLAAADTIAAAGTTDLGSKDNTYLTLTGTATTITALGTVSAGIYKAVIYNAAHSLTHNATSLILMGGASRTVAAGDVSLFISEGSGNWRELVYQKVDGTPLVQGTVAIAKGGTGQTTQTAAFDALSPNTTQGDITYHNGTNNVRLAAGTSGYFLKTQGAGANPVWAAGGGVAQVAYAELVTSSTTTALIPVDDTIPQITEGTEILTCSITPTSASSYLLVNVVANLQEDTNTTDQGVVAAVFRDSTADALAAQYVGHAPAASGSLAGLNSGRFNFQFRVAASSTSATTFRLRVGGEQAGTYRWNGWSSGRKFGGVLITSMTITEITP